MRHIRTSLLASLLLICTAGPLTATEFTTGLLLGHGVGNGGDFSLEAARFAEGLPFSLRLGLGYGLLDPGDAVAARHVFINDNENGTPEADGHAITWRLDLVRALRSGPFAGLRVYGGPRYAGFTGTFTYVGGNEEFDVTAEQWGWGAGLERRWPIGERWGFTLGGGAEYYLAAALTGHDTTYSPDGDNVNDREGYDYDSADDAIDQPKLEWRLGIGVDMRLGR